MIFNFLKTIKNGNFINFYLANYTNELGENKDYEIVSRKKTENPEDLFNKKADAVSIIAYSPDNQKILLQKEFRLSINNWVWSFPAGLIDNDEDPEESARRELQEETGLTLIDIIRKLPPCYTSVGMSNEMIVPIYCHANGTFEKSTSAMEEIEPQWFTKEELKEMILATEKAMKDNKPYIAFTNRVSAEIYKWTGLL